MNLRVRRLILSTVAAAVVSIAAAYLLLSDPAGDAGGTPGIAVLDRARRFSRVRFPCASPRDASFLLAAAPRSRPRDPRRALRWLRSSPSLGRPTAAKSEARSLGTGRSSTTAAVVIAAVVGGVVFDGWYDAVAAGRSRPAAVVYSARHPVASAAFFVLNWTLAVAGRQRADRHPDSHGLGPGHWRRRGKPGRSGAACVADGADVPAAERCRLVGDCLCSSFPCSRRGWRMRDTSRRGSCSSRRSRRCRRRWTHEIRTPVTTRAG